MIVVDVGCYHHPTHAGRPQDSIGLLLERFQPRTLYGFDPHPGLPVGSTLENGVRVIRERRAAWLRDGTVGFTTDPARPLGALVTEHEGESVPCFDLAAFLGEKLIEGEIVLKLDVEGAEYQLLSRIIDEGVDEFLTLILVEWHDRRRWQARRRLQRSLRCPVEPW